jgi:ATP-dependent helicase HrpA
LPPELRMNVRVLDTSGNVVGESRDFLSLRKELLPTMPVAELRRPEKDFYEAHKRALKTQIQYLPNVDKLRLYAKSLPNFNFDEEVGLLIANRAAIVRLRNTSQSKDCGSECVVSVQEVTTVIAPMLENYHQAKLAIERNKPHPAALEAEEHLQRLTLPGFLTATDWIYLREYPRYFQAVPMRLEKMRSGGEAADRQGVAELDGYWKKYLQRKELHELAGITDTELEVFRWMIEEYRVSLFAQRLGTSMKVSPQRLNRQFEKVKR